MSKADNTTDKTGVSKKTTEIDQKQAQELYVKNKAEKNKALHAALKKEAEDQAKAVKASKKPKGKQVDLVATSNLSGKYNLPYSVGQKFSIGENQAKEILENKDAEAVK